MRPFYAQAPDEGKRLDRFLASGSPMLPASLAQKFIRLKRVKINGKIAKPDARLCEGDLIEVYAEDESFERTPKPDTLLSRFRVNIRVLYEDGQVLLVDKRPGMLVHPDETEKVHTLVTHARAYLYQKGEYDPANPAAFAPVPCNRIDRFTGGIVMIAKTKAAMEALNQKIREREIEKRYLCVTLGVPAPRDGMLEGYITKEGKRVSVSRTARPGAQFARTNYRTLAQRDGLSLVECELVTGRTHQIRAQFAHAGRPLLGDGQYGDRAANRRYGVHQQALYAYQVTFRFKTGENALTALAGRCFTVPDVPFARGFSQP